MFPFTKLFAIAFVLVVAGSGSGSGSVAHPPNSHSHSDLGDDCDRCFLLMVGVCYGEEPR